MSKSLNFARLTLIFLFLHILWSTLNDRPVVVTTVTIGPFVFKPVIAALLLALASFFFLYYLIAQIEPN